MEVRWLGFESPKVVEETKRIRSGWTEEEHRERAGIPSGYTVPVYGAGGVYDRPAVRERIDCAIAQLAKAVIFGRRIDGTTEGAKQTDQAE